MRVITLILAASVAGCGGISTVEDAEDALIACTTGAVPGDCEEIRQTLISLEKRDEKRKPNCPRGYVEVVDGRFGDSQCVEQGQLGRVFWRH